MAREGEVKGLDDHQVWDNGNINIVISSINEVFSRKGISGCHLSAGCDLPMNIKVL